VVEFRISNETKTRKDVDNLTTKFIFDGFVDAGLFEDDSYFFVNPLIVSMDYNKEYPHTEIRISIIDDEIKDIYEKTQIHINNWK
jgi:Holliday junction resolvase RusA-like endonuclease